MEGQLRQKVHDSYPQFIKASREISDVQEEIGAVRHLLTDTLEAITHMDELPDMIEETIGTPAGGGQGGGSMVVSLARLAFEGAAGYDLQHHSDEVLDMLDELDGRIVEHRFDAAVACIEKAWLVLEGAERGEQEARVLDAELRERIPLVVKGIWKQVAPPAPCIYPKTLARP